MGDVSTADMIAYIDQHIIDLSVEENDNILKMILDSGIEDNKVQTKGGGTQIKYKDIKKHIIANIYYYIQNKIVEKMEVFKYFPDEEN